MFVHGCYEPRQSWATTSCDCNRPAPLHSHLHETPRCLYSSPSRLSSLSVHHSVLTSSNTAKQATNSQKVAFQHAFRLSSSTAQYWPPAISDTITHKQPRANQAYDSTEAITIRISQVWRSPTPSVLWHCWLGGRKSIRHVKNGGWWRWALVSPDGVASSRMVGEFASVNLPLHHKVQKFSSGTGSPGWSRKKYHKTVVVVKKSNKK